MLQTVILAGGLATRMRPATDTVPKALLPVNGVPFAHLQLAWLREQGVTDVVYCIAHLGEQIEAAVGDGSAWGVRVAYSDEGEHRLGTAGAVRLAADRGLLADEFLVLYGDSYLQVDVRRVHVAFRVSRKPALMTVYHNVLALERCNVRYDDGEVLLYEKGVDDPSAHGMFHVDYGLQVYRRDVIDECVPAGAVMDLADVQHRLSVERRMAGMEVYDRYFEIGSPEGLAALEQHLRTSPLTSASPARSHL